MKLSIVIPVYNEIDRINKGLEIISQWHQQYPDWEFILVDDGSTDSTVQEINKYKFIKLVSYQINQGKGYALKQGVIQASQPLVLLSDIDWSTPLTELPKLIAKIDQADLVIGSRKMTGAKILKHQPKFREWLGKQFTNLSCLWLNLKVTDFTCGFKLFKIEAAKNLYAKSKINRWGYDAEILFLAKKMGYKIIEVPVVWQNDAKTKVNLMTDVLQSFFDLIRIRF